MNTHSKTIVFQKKSILINEYTVCGPIVKFYTVYVNIQFNVEEIPM